MEDEVNKNNVDGVKENNSSEGSLVDTPTTTNHNGNIKYVIFGLFGFIILIGLFISTTNRPAPTEETTLTPGQAQERTQQVLEVKDFGATILEVVSDTLRSDSALLLQDNEQGEVPKSEMTLRVTATVPDASEVESMDFSKGTSLKIPKTEKEIILNIDPYTKINNGTFNDLTPDAIIQAKTAEPILSGAGSYYVREITILK